MLNDKLPCYSAAALTTRAGDATEDRRHQNVNTLPVPQWYNRIFGVKYSDPRSGKHDSAYFLCWLPELSDLGYFAAVPDRSSHRIKCKERRAIFRKFCIIISG